MITIETEEIDSLNDRVTEIEITLKLIISEIGEIIKLIKKMIKLIEKMIK